MRNKWKIRVTFGGAKNKNSTVTKEFMWNTYKHDLIEKVSLQRQRRSRNMFKGLNDLCIYLISHSVDSMKWCMTDRLKMSQTDTWILSIKERHLLSLNKVYILNINHKSIALSCRSLLTRNWLVLKSEKIDFCLICNRAILAWSRALRSIPDIIFNFCQ